MNGSSTKILERTNKQCTMSGHLSRKESIKKIPFSTEALLIFSNIVLAPQSRGLTHAWAKSLKSRGDRLMSKTYNKIIT